MLDAWSPDALSASACIASSQQLHSWLLRESTFVSLVDRYRREAPNAVWSSPHCRPPGHNKVRSPTKSMAQVLLEPVFFLAQMERVFVRFGQVA
jgi:hypothetical protein